MGIIRKTMSIGTLGAVDLRSDKERIARNTKHTRKAVQEQTRLQAQLVQLQSQAAAQQAAAALTAAQAHSQPAIASAGPPPCWTVDQTNPALLRWWDGQRLTEHTRPLGV